MITAEFTMDEARATADTLTNGAERVVDHDPPRWSASGPPRRGALWRAC